MTEGTQFAKPDFTAWCEVVDDAASLWLDETGFDLRDVRLIDFIRWLADKRREAEHAN